LATALEPDFRLLRAAARAARDRSGLTIDQVAARSGLSRDAVLDLLNCPDEGRVRSWWRLARGLWVEFAELAAVLGPTAGRDGEAGRARGRPVV
jgi:transcriptional regulator with XRE-family HTH domain